MTETIGVTVTFKDPITFHLRMIGVAEEAALRQKMFGKTEAEREAVSYQNNVDLLAVLSTAQPDIEEIFPDNAPAENVRAFFGEKSVIKERIAEYAVRGYFVKLVPDISFV